MRGFEPPASSSRTKRATRLRYIPIKLSKKNGRAQEKRRFIPFVCLPNRGKISFFYGLSDSITCINALTISNLTITQIFLVIAHHQNNRM